MAVLLRSRALASLVVAGALVTNGWTGAASAADLSIALTGTPDIVYDPTRDACEPIDIPDMNPRAFRDAADNVVMFALHYQNRPLRGPDLDHLKLDCNVSLASPLDPEPSHYADRYWVASTWTANGRDVSALIHHEYHADEHHRCTATTALACWFNTILAFHSSDGGTQFTKANPLVVASAPFPQDVDQERHRGFFEPSNMFGDGTFVYAFTSTTGWAGQEAGSCLFRSRNPADPALWRAYDGKSFSIAYHDPYRQKGDVKPCKVIEPFYFSVGSVVRHEPSRTWIAVFAAANGYHYDVTGFYYAASTDLLHWSPAHLLMAGSTLATDPCKAGPSIISYPTLLDPQSKSRNFDVIGDNPFFYFVRMKVENCQTTARLLLKQTVDLTGAKPSAPAQ